MSKIELTAIDREETLRYLRRNSDIQPDADLTALLNRCETEFLSVIQPRYVWRVFDIEGGTPGENEKQQRDWGQSVRQHLAGCSRAVLLAATLGGGPDRLLRLSQINDMAAAVIFDAMASAAIEQVCDQAEALLLAEHPHWSFTWRFSPGYGDFPLACQAEFLSVLDGPRKIGLCATDSFLLTPKKSVTAVIGLSEKEIKREKRSCISCNLYETCTFRKGGYRCEPE